MQNKETFLFRASKSGAPGNAGIQKWESSIRKFTKKVFVTFL